MKLSLPERETLLAPLVIGIFIGLLGVLSVARNSPDQYQPIEEQQGPALHEVLLGFFLGFSLVFIPFGAAPVLIVRAYARANPDAG
ncbi:hypothetical protein CR152_06340 [Massilia violaceinigra]|uniref:Uncharacterized protein n=1 Tax=Massilia violaceinigra TaxID=2045208 RepID=A0A2D2DGQ1_9BURK|nr:hypothetical protein [Massilia violaceinigra]ATQ74168.1 hypothetical protein CR152_06340 [Massilia violaceinigra]